MTVASNSTTEADLAKLNRSRRVLTNAFNGERRSIECELYDGVQHYLTALQMNVATLEFPANKGGVVRVPIAEVETNARQAIEALRSTTPRHLSSGPGEQEPFRSGV